MKICVYTLGCKVNQYESYSLINALRERGYDVTENLEVCDKYIINTCAVTGEAERKSRQVISKIERLNPSAPIYVTGCASQNNPQAFSQKTNVRYVSGTAKKHLIIEMLEGGGDFTLPDRYEDNFETVNVKTRAYIKIQDGCNNFCSYCIVPYLRGRSRSRSIESIKAEIEKLLPSVKEFILTGINISDYGRAEGKTLSDLIGALSQINARIRLGSLEAGVIDETLLKALSRLKKFCPHFHLSLQSGSDKVLKEMNRHYTSQEYLQSVRLVRQYFPTAAITTDVICGYPTETKEDFEETLRTCREAEFADMHVFIYSKRSGTAAASLTPICGEEAKRRSALLTQLKLELKQKFAAKNIGKEREFLCETKEGQYLTGYTENYLKLYIENDTAEENKLYTAVVYEIYGEGAKGKIIEEAGK